MKHPDRVASLVLIAPAATVHSMPAFYTHMFVPKLLHVMAPWLPGCERSMNRAVDWMNAGLPSDSAWDAVHAFIRVPGGALLAAGVFGADNATMGVVAGLLGGSLAATSLATKMTTRAAANTSPEPFSNWGLSFFEDGLVIAVVWLATQHPVAFGVAMVLMVAVSVLLLVVLFKFLRAVVRRLSSFFSGSAKVA